MHHGDIRFYTSLYFLNEKRVYPTAIEINGGDKVHEIVAELDGSMVYNLSYEFREYIARFTDGVCVWIKRASEVSYEL